MIRLLLPLAVFIALLGLLIAGLQTSEQRQVVQSPLIGQPVPEFSLPGLHQPETLRGPGDLAGQPWLLNVWGSWCWACREEHPWIERLGEEAGVPLVGFNWNDERENALRWLQQFGDAWDFHMVDSRGRAAIDLGVYGAPETFLIDAEGVIRHKHVGPLDATTFDDLMRRVLRLRAEAES